MLDELTMELPHLTLLQATILIFPQLQLHNICLNLLNPTKNVTHLQAISSKEPALTSSSLWVILYLASPRIGSLHTS